MEDLLNLELRKSSALSAPMPTPTAAITSVGITSVLQKFGIAPALLHSVRASIISKKGKSTEAARKIEWFVQKFITTKPSMNMLPSRWNLDGEIGMMCNCLSRLGRNASQRQMISPMES